MNLVSIDLQYLKEAYFAYDEPVPYQCKNGDIVNIIPISVKNSAIFRSSIDVIAFDKNNLNDSKIISMSYLEFIVELMRESSVYVQKFVNILKLCLGFNYPMISFNETNNKPLITDKEINVQITYKDFENIRRIILYQNIPKYDDEYIDPDLKKAMEETDKLRYKNIEPPDFERRCAIITAHCGLSKKDQLEMTMRSHSILFDEVCGEVEFTTTRAIALFGGKGNEIEHWIYHKKKDKFDGYIMGKDDLVGKMGGEGKFAESTNTSRGDSLEQLYKQGGK